MPSVVQICNTALNRIGESDSIASITEDSNQANVCNLNYERIRDELLSDWHWKFARKFAALALVEEADTQAWATEWHYAYRFPSDCIHVRTILSGAGRNDPIPPEFEIGSDSSGLLIFTDIQDAKAEYTSRITNTGLFPQQFTEALIWRLAADIATPLRRSDAGSIARYEQMAMQYLAKAKAFDANHSTRNWDDKETEFLRARY